MKTKIVAVKIANPAQVAREFGECAGDCAGEAIAYWVGTPGDLSPVAALPEGAEVITAPVRYAGGAAWIQHGPVRAKSSPSRGWAMWLRTWATTSELARGLAACRAEAARGGRSDGMRQRARQKAACVPTIPLP